MTGWQEGKKGRMEHCNIQVDDYSDLHTKKVSKVMA